MCLFLFSIRVFILLFHSQRLKAVVLQENLNTSDSMGMRDEEGMHLCKNKILMYPRDASEVPFMKRAFYEMLTNVRSFQKHLEDMENSWN